MKNKAKYILILFLFPLVLVAPRVLAQSEATPEAETTVDPEIKEKVEERIQKVLDSKDEAKTNEKKAFF